MLRELDDLGQVVVDQPEVVEALRVPLQDDDASGHPCHLAQAGDRIGPVVVRENRHRGVA